MKTFLALFAILGVGFVQSASFKYPKEEPCELLNVDATFDLTATKDEKTISSKANLSNNANVNGTCSDKLPNLSLDLGDSAEWTLTFMINSDNMTEMTMLYKFNQSKLFPKMDLDPKIQTLASKSISLSKDTQSFMCHSTQEYKFVPSKSADNKTTFSLTVTVKDLQVQAFNVANGKFSKAEECPQDLTSTSAKTSESSQDTTKTSETTRDTSETSKGTSDTTQETKETTMQSSETSPQTTEPKSTPVPDNTYRVKDNDTTCIIMQAQIVLTIQYETKDKKMVMSKPFSVPSDASASGTCPTNSSDSNATITIDYFDDTIEFTFTDKDGEASLESVTITVVTDQVRFPNASDPSAVLNMTAEIKAAQTKDTTFYLCKFGDTITFPDGKSTVQLTNEKFQAFNVENNTFNGQGTECSADLSTSTAMPSSTTPKPAPAGPPVNQYTVSKGDYVCIVMNASMYFSITYNTTDGKEMTKNIDVPSHFNVSGSCPKNASSESMTISFFNGWSITWVFSQLSAQMVGATADSNYDVENITITYILDDMRFPNTSVKGEQTVEAVNVKKFQAGAGGSYMCNSNVTINVDNGKVNLTTSNLIYKAFQTNSNSTTFDDKNQTECPADTETNSIVPIAVGAALAGLVVIVLIAYLIGRRKSRRAGYESV